MRPSRFWGLTDKPGVSCRPSQPGVNLGRRSASLFLGVLPFLAGTTGCQAADIESAEEVVPLYFGNGMGHPVRAWIL